jgi:MFS family permease
MNTSQALSADRRPSRSSILGLDALTFLMADVRDGVGPYLSVFLKGGLHWQSGEIGIAMAATSIAAAICQIPAGLLVDSVCAKRLLIVISGLMVGLGCLLVVCVPKLVVVVSV